MPETKAGWGRDCPSLEGKEVVCKTACRSPCSAFPMTLRQFIASRWQVVPGLFDIGCFLPRRWWGRPEAREGPCWPQSFAWKFERGASIRRFITGWFPLF